VAKLNEADPNLELEVRIAVNTGEALVALGSRPELGEGMASGDVVNTAARLQTAAPVNGILAGETTYRATQHAIEYRDSPPVDAKGKSKSVRAWEVVVARSRYGLDVEQQVLVRLAKLARSSRTASGRAGSLFSIPALARQKSRTVASTSGSAGGRKRRDVRRLTPGRLKREARSCFR
jgi:hypothetical protein